MSKIVIEDTYNNKLYYLTGVEGLHSDTRATITQYTTTSGTKISDNSYIEPKTLNFTVHISNIAMNPQKVFDNNTQKFTELTAKDIQTVVKEWITQAIRLNITTFSDYFENMVIQNLPVDEDALDYWKSTITFNEVRKANVEFITLDFPKDSKEAAAGSGEQNIGTNNGISAGDVGAVIGTTASGALVGAAIGSVIPGVGTVAGAVLGGVYGLFQGLIGW